VKAQTQTSLLHINLVKQIIPALDVTFAFGKGRYVRKEMLTGFHVLILNLKSSRAARRTV